MIFLFMKVRSLEEQLAQAQQQLQMQEAAALQQQQQKENNNRKEADDLPVEGEDKKEEEEERDGDDAFDPHGRRPAKFKNVKDANARIDQLVAEVQNLNVFVVFFFFVFCALL